MGDDYGKDYSAFKAKCDEMGLKEVTEEEWKVHSPSSSNARHWGLMTAIRRIKNARRGIGVPKDLKVVVGYPLGGREYVPGDGDLDKSWKQFIPVLTKAGVVEVDTEGEYKGQHGAKSEIRYEESTTPRKDGDGFYTNRTIQEVIVGKESIPLSTLKAHLKGIDDLTRDMLKTPVVVSGVIGDTFYPEKIFEDRKPVDEWDVWLNENPCLQFNMNGSHNILKVRFAPRKISKAMIEVKDFNEVARSGNLATVAQSFSGTPVIVVGILSRWEDARSPNGKNFVQLIATAMFEIPDMDLKQAQLGDPAEEDAVFSQKFEGDDEAKAAPAAAPPLPVTATPVPATPATTPATVTAPPATPKPTPATPQPQAAPAPKPKEVPPLTPPTKAPTTVKERSSAIREGVKKAAEVLGGIDKVTVQNATEVNKALWTWGPSSQTIQIAIDREKEKAKK